MTEKAVSMKDIAHACGVSIATVSKSLNDQSDIGTETKKRIQAVAESMGYFPNSAARALKTDRTNNIGVLFVDGARSGLTHDYFAYVLNSFKHTAEEAGFDITFINNSYPRLKGMSYLAHAKYRSFDGVVIACVDFDDPGVKELVNGDIPVVTIDHIFNNRTAIVSNNVKGMHDLVNYIVKMGHKRIAFVHGMGSSVTKNRLSSFYKTLEENGITVPDEYVLEAPYRDTDKTYECTKKLLKLKNRPTCIIFPDDFAAFGGIRAIREMGLRVPDDISIAGYDGIPIGRRLTPPLTTIMQDTEKIGSIAAEKLIEAITKPKLTSIEQINVDAKLYEGGSVAALK